LEPVARQGTIALDVPALETALCSRTTPHIGPLSSLVVDRFIEVDAGKICADARGNPAQKR